VSVTSTSADVSGFFHINAQLGLTWQSNATPDLTGPKLIMIGCSDLATGGYVSSGTNSQSYLCSCPIQTLDFGDILSHEPPMEHVTNFGLASKFVASITLSIVDAATNTLIPLTADWSAELKFYVDVKQ
jgi:hypothetical protein